MNAKPVKLSEHLARITEMFFKSAYVRDSDKSIVVVEKFKVTVKGQVTQLVCRDDHIYFNEFILREITDNALIWDAEDYDSVVWKTGDYEYLTEAGQYLEDLLQGNGKIPTNKAKTEEKNQVCTTQSLPSVGEVNKMTLPNLKELDFLPIHFEQITDLAKNLGIIRIGPEGDKVHNPLKVVFAMKILDSLRDTPGAQDIMRQVMMTSDYDFFAIKDALLKTYCNRPRLRYVMKERLNQLRFQSFARVEQFITSASTLLSVITRLYDREWLLEYTSAVSNIIAKLPATIRGRVHGKLTELAANGRWELAIPFDECCSNNPIFENNFNSETIADVIRRCALRQIELEELNGTTPFLAASAPPAPRTERVNRVYNETADEFARKFRTSFVVFPKRSISVEKATSALQSAGFAVRTQMSKNETPYFIIGGNSDDAELEITKLQSIGLKHRPFKFRESKNSE
jgi:hypothetical protein